MTLVELSALNAMIKSMKTTATIRCTLFLNRSFFGLPKISTQRLVVMAVIAESALEKLAATIPIVKKITTIFPIYPDAANIGSKSSGASGIGIPCF